MSPTSISFVLPMFNEAETIGRSVRELAGLAKDASGDYEIIIADDASTDGSADVAEALAKENPHVKVMRLEKNTKFGGALWAGIRKAKNEIIVYTDSDLPVEAQDIKNALEILKTCDIVTAFSTVRKGETLRRIIISKVYNFLIQILFRANIKDINSGLKLYRRKVFERMNLLSKSPFIDVEIFMRAKRRGFVIKQYPIIFKHREKGASHISRPAVIMRTAYDMLRFWVGRR